MQLAIIAITIKTKIHSCLFYIQMLQLNPTMLFTFTPAAFFLVSFSTLLWFYNATARPKLEMSIFRTQSECDAVKKQPLYIYIFFFLYILFVFTQTQQPIATVLVVWMSCRSPKNNEKLAYLSQIFKTLLGANSPLGLAAVWHLKSASDCLTDILKFVQKNSSSLSLLCTQNPQPALSKLCGKFVFPSLCRKFQSWLVWKFNINLI